MGTADEGLGRDVHSAGDVNLENPDDEVQTSTERTIDRAAAEAGGHIAAAVSAGWGDPERAANPTGDYDLMEDVDPERPAAYVDPESPAAYADPHVELTEPEPGPGEPSRDSH